MVESSPDDPSLLKPTNSHALPNPYRAGHSRPAPPLGHSSSGRSDASASNRASHGFAAVASHGVSLGSSSNTSRSKDPNDTKAARPPPAPPPPEIGHGEESPAIGSFRAERENPNIAVQFLRVCREILFSTWLNVLLVFVPIGIAVRFAGVNGSIVFAMNAVAIVPLAGLLSHATESVASDMGDTVGSLMNVTFGNAVELIILYEINLWL